MRPESIFFMAIFFIFVFLSIGCSFRQDFVNFRDDDFDADQLCGLAIYGTPPCAYVREVNFYIQRRGEVSDELYQYSRSRLNGWVYEKSTVFSNFSIKTKIDKWFGVNMSLIREKENSISIYFFIEKQKNKNYISVIFTSFSKSEFFVSAVQCDINGNLRQCVETSINNYLEINFFESITKNRN